MNSNMISWNALADSNVDHVNELKYVISGMLLQILMWIICRIGIYSLLFGCILPQLQSWHVCLLCVDPIIDKIIPT
jgi:hypothetical protein